MSRCGTCTCEAFIAEGNMEISLRLNSSHLDKLMKMPSDGARSSIMESARRTACLGPHHPSTIPEG